MVDLELPEPGQAAGRDDDLGLLGELAVGRLLDVLPRVDVTADQAPAVRVDAWVLVPLLEQHPAPPVDEHHTREATAPIRAVSHRASVGGRGVIAAP